ncbi:DDB1- and CUL4-associated factor 8 isoform X2 [Drosophila obscura]|uniref:DDB1- and CUL4-associated factor 8 isoform X2 n=1 Tax=Drosophila obscura TaxID=7282 RepID=UPI001BB2CE5C|nr:DDB1- and CUL4-associated factor 8 isoform X2 [Drosophila obscura]
MDPDEDSNAEAASARKRQKRQDSGDEDESSSSRSVAGDATMDVDSAAAPAVEEKTAVVSETEIGTDNYSSTNTSNNDYNGVDSNREGGMSSKQILPQGEAAEGNDEPMNPPEEAATGITLVQGVLSPAAASAVLAADTVANASEAIDSDDDEPSEVEVNPGTSNDTHTSPTFNQRNIPSTRSYRRITVELVATLETSSDSESAVAPVLPSVDEEAEETAEAAIPNPDDDHTSSDGDTNHSRGEDDFWNHYDSSTSNTSSDGGLAEHSDWIEPEPNAADRENIDFAVNEILYKDKPPYTWNSAHELMQREHNIINRIEWRGGHTSAQSFGRGFYGSRHVVEQMSLWDTMIKHNGCVNCLNFNRAGDLLCSGSDDTRIIVWDWANNKPLHSFKSGHHTNIFQTKFIDSAGCLDIVSTSRDGQVRRAVIPPSGGDTKPTRLYTHSDAVHKLVVVPHTKHEVMSAGEDGAVKHFDLRTSTSANTMLRCNYTEPERRSRVRLFSISHHPFAPEFCVSGADDNLRVYDKRKLPEPIHEMTPRGVRETKITQVTCAVYNHSGSEILASYSDAGIFLYDSRNYKEGETLHCYEGHVNHRTIKGVNFFGPRSEYVISGSDCGHIFFWDRNTESIVNYMKGDIAGVVNCLEPHPWMPVLATSGLEHNVKIWTPHASDPPPGKHIPKSEGLRDTLYRNFRRSIWETVGDDNASHQFQLFFRQFMGDGSVMARFRNRRLRRRLGIGGGGGVAAAANANADADAAPGSLPQHEENSSSASSSASDDSSVYGRDGNSSDDADDEAYAGLNTGCNTQ